MKLFVNLPSGVKAWKKSCGKWRMNEVLLSCSRKTVGWQTWNQEGGRR